MPPNLRRLLPLIIVAFFLLFLLPTLLKKKSTSGLSASARATQTINAMNLIDKGEQAYKAAHAGYTAHLADPGMTRHGLPQALVIGLAVPPDAGRCPQTD